MSRTSFPCPACKVTLSPPKHIPAGTRLVCPYCDSRFSLSMEISPPSPLAREPGRRVKEIEWTHSTPAPQQRNSAARTEPLPVVAPADLKKLYRRFVLILIGTIAILSAGFGTVLFVVAKDRDRIRAILTARTSAEVSHSREDQSLLAAKEKEEDQRRTDFRQRMVQGGVALGNHHFEEAVKEYQSALQLYPEDVDAAKGLSAARTALEVEARAKKEEDKRQSEFTRLMNQGQDAMKNKEFSDAAQAFDNALKLIPEDAAAAKAYREAADALESQQLAKKKAADYESHMTSARAAMVGQRYADARNEFLAALQLKPEDEAAMNGRKLAETRLNELQDQDKRRADFNHFMDQGDRALRNRRYEEAERAYTKAVNLMPRDLDARNGLKEAQKGVEKVKQEFTRLIGQGDLAMQTNRFGDAVRAYNQATKLIPDNDAANEKLQTAQKALDDLSNAQATYNRLMLQGATAMRLGRFGDATTAFSAALRLVPGDLDALAGLRSARAAMFGPPIVPVFP